MLNNENEEETSAHIEQELSDFEKELLMMKAYIMRGEDYSEEEFAQIYPKVAGMTISETVKK